MVMYDGYLTLLIGYICRIFWSGKCATSWKLV